MSFALLMTGFVLFGLIARRWWALLAALPIGVVMGALSDPWEVSKFHCGVAWTCAALFGIGVGLLARAALQTGANAAAARRH